MTESVYDKARVYLSKFFSNDVFQKVSDDDCKDALEIVYIGGWERFCADYMPTRHDPTPTALQRYRAACRAVGAARIAGLGPLDEVQEVTEQSGVIGIFIRHYKVIEMQTRWRVAEASTRAILYIQKDDKWVSISDTSSQDETFTPYDLMTKQPFTEERKLESDWQWQNCFRPGTTKTPIDGPGRRAWYGEDEIT